MTNFVFLPGAGGAAWYWHRVVPLLEAEGHKAIAVDLPGNDDNAGLSDYADRVVEMASGRRDIVLVAQSLGGFTAPLVCDRIPVRKLVFVNAMIPLPDETAGDWWGATGADAARRDAARQGGYDEEFDLAIYFLHDLSPEIISEGARHQRAESGAAFSEPCRFEHWPEIPTGAIVGADDRFFPAGFQRRVASERLGLSVEVLAGGHLVALSNPEGLAAALMT